MIGVTGGDGFVGSHINFADKKLGKKECPLNDLYKTIDCFKKHNFDTIIHCAAKQKNYHGMNKFQADHYYDNAVINLNLFKASQISGVNTIITLSSINAIPNSNNLFEDNLWIGEPDSNCYTDGHKNRMLHILAKAYNNQYGIRCLTPMLSNTYGPNSKIDNGVIPILIDKCLNSKYNDTDLIISGDGSAERDFIYIKDVIKIIKWMIEQYHGNEPIILSSGSITNVKEIVDIIVDEINFKGRVIYDDKQTIGQNSKICSNQKLLGLLPKFKFTKIEDGIRQTIQTMRKKYV
tara:strand:+ start:743 stop:1618 length:876 start_codon:yes stop_codon:yes gene_type:complete